MVPRVVQPPGLCLVVLGFDFCLALAFKLDGEGHCFPSGGWIFCYLLSIKLLSALCNSLTSGCNIFIVFHRGFHLGIFHYFPELLFCFNLWRWSCLLAETQLPVSMCLMCSIRAATCSPVVLPSFTNTKLLKTTCVSNFLSGAALSILHYSCLTISCFLLNLAVFWV